MGNIVAQCLVCCLPSQLLLHCVHALRPETSEDIDTLINIAHQLDYRVSLLEKRLHALSNGPMRKIKSMPDMTRSPTA